MADNYREDLPKGCPPPEAEEIATTRYVFRLVKNNPATDDDFLSQRARFPNETFQCDECTARGVSVLDTKAEADNKRKLPSWKNGGLICHVTLCAGAGKIKQTFKTHHWTWWPYASYAILKNCEVVS